MFSRTRHSSLARSLALALVVFCAAATAVRAAEPVRIGLPTKTFWPTIVAETALRQKLFEREGIGSRRRRCYGRRAHRPIQRGLVPSLVGSRRAAIAVA